MSYKIEFYFSPANELLLSLHLFMTKALHKRLEMGMDWSKELKRNVPSSFFTKIEEYDMDHKLDVLHLLSLRAPKQQDAKQFLLWLQNLSAGEMYELLAPALNSFPDELGAIRDQCVEVLSEWESVYFHAFPNEILAGLQKEAAERSLERPVEDVASYVEAVTNGLYFEPLETVKRIVLIPSYHARPLGFPYAYNNLTICFYGVDPQASDDPIDPGFRLLRVARSLSDKNRIRILHLLREKPHTFIEIVRQTGFAKSSAHEHILALRSAGLIRAHIDGHTATNYSFRKEGFAPMHQLLQSFET